MKLNIKIFALVFIIIQSSIHTYAQEDNKSQTIDSLYTLLSDQVNTNNYIDIVNTVNEIEPLLEEWTASLELIKMNAYYQLVDLSKTYHPEFMKLLKSAQTIINNANGKKTEDLPLYFEYYERAFQIQKKLLYIQKRNNWLVNNQYINGAKLYKEKKYEQAFQLFKSIADKNPAAQLMIGNMYQLGLGVAKNETTAYKVFQESYQNGNIDAAYHIGLLLFYGTGVTKNLTMAFNWCLLAAEYNYRPAIIDISNMYSKGFGTIKDEDAAKAWKNKIEKGWAAYDY